MIVDRISSWLTSRRYKPVPFRHDTAVPDAYPFPLEMAELVLHTHYHLLNDSKRVSHFRKAIEDLVTPEHTVLDIGTGSGILALLAAERAKHVYAIEVDPAIARFAARAFHASSHRDKLSLFLGDVMKLRLPERVDVITCELLDTALLNEPQVEVLRLATKRLLKPNGWLIPAYARNLVTLVDCPFDFYERIDLPVAHWERPDLTSTTELSSCVEYCCMRIGPNTPESVETQVVLHGTRHGTATAIKLITITGFGNGDEVGPCPSMNRPIVIPLPDKLEIVPGAAYVVRLAYRFSERYQKVRCSARRTQAS